MSTGRAETGGYERIGITADGRPTVTLLVLGCKVNQYDAEVLRARLVDEGFAVVDSRAEPDIFIIASCAVTREAAAKSRRAVRRARRENPDAIVLLVGCYPQAVVGRDATADRDERRRLEELPTDHILGVSAGEDVVRIAGELVAGGSPSDAEISDLWRRFPSGEISGLTQRAAHARVPVKVQDGCDEFCSYCIIPHLRGPMRARPSEEVAQEIQCLLDHGHREIVLTGIHLGAYGRSRGADVSLSGLLERLSRIEGHWRLRLSSLEPMDIEREIFRVMARSSRIVHHLHLPLQSGSDSVLRSMGRGYSTDEFMHLVRQARRWMPDVGISTDIMVGYPTETEANHRESVRFVREVGFSRIHVFPYSPRPGTRAVRLESTVPGDVRRRRRDEMLEVAARSSEQFHAGLAGKVVQVLAERVVRCNGATMPFDVDAQDGPVLYGYSDSYAPVWFSHPAGRDAVGELLPVWVVDTERRGCWGCAHVLDGR